MSVFSYSLPIEKYQNELLKVINENRNTIIKGPTGCGKSTFVPWLLRDKKVAIIEPRRIAVTALYNILSAKIDNVGYKMRFNRRVNSNTTMTIFSDGAFLNTIHELDYDYIIIDEVHERTLRTDLILSVLRSNYRNKLILMSATLNTAKLAAFFKAYTYEVPGGSHPVDIKYLEAPTGDYITECYLTIKHIIKTRDSGEKHDILVFLPGEEDINELHKLCRRNPVIQPYKVHATMSDQDQMKIYENSALTRVILSTNICETSLTIPNIKYVIDTGLYKNKIYDGLSYLGIQAISWDSATQRMGRCNRLGPGVCYKLYTASQPLAVSMPEIMRSDLTSFLLFLINMKRNVFNIDLIDYPPIKNVVSGLEFLVTKKCIQIVYNNTKYDSFEALRSSLSKTQHESTVKSDNFVDPSEVIKNLDLKITSYGRKIAFHPFDVHLAHFYEQCVNAKVGYYGSILVSLISQENYNFLSQTPEKISDIESLIAVFEGYEQSENKREYCIQKQCTPRGLDVAVKVFKTLNHTKEGDIATVERLFSSCFDHNVCNRSSDGSYVLERTGQQVFIHPSSGFFKRKDPKIVVVDLFCSSKVYSRIVGRYF